MIVSAPQRAAAGWLTLGLAGFALLPWYALQEGVLALNWLGSGFAAERAAPALLQAAVFDRAWLWGGLLALLACAAAALLLRERGRLGAALLIASGLGLAYLVLQSVAIGPAGWSFASFENSFAPLERGQLGVGFGALCVVTALLMLFAQGLALRGAFRGDGFVSGSVVVLIALIAVFTFAPVATMLSSAVRSVDNGASIALFWNRFSADKVWGLACLTGPQQCGVAWNTLVLAFSTATCATALGLAFAFIAVRSGFRYKKLLRALTVLPIITPPFVIGLGLILIFGRSGLVNQFLEWAFHIEPSRWIYGFQGVLLAQVFAFTPIAFLVLIGVVEGVSPSMEEAAQTLGANRWRTFIDVSLPLMRPGIANAFLIAFIESMADFGNPIVLGGNFGVMSTEIFFSIVGAQLDQGRAAALAIILLGFALGAFFLQRRIVGSKVYTSVAGKGDAGLRAQLPVGVKRLAFAIALPWAALTIVVYAMAVAGGFVETWGRDYSLTLRHYAKAFSIGVGEHGLVWTGAAWNSFWTTLQLATAAAPLTAALGILTAWLLTRQRFAGRSAFEFGTMLSFAVPGTVIGVSYILAFNAPPVELTGTALILVVCFMFRNMPVGVRAGMAAMSQLDKSLDEASLVLGASSARTLRKVVLPLLKPAIIAALVYSFVRAVTTVSAIIFLVSADHEMATVYIINRVINGDYGVAIAYCTVLIVLMLGAIGLIRLLVGERKLGRRAASAPASSSPSPSMQAVRVRAA